jgi:hypothetical protein
VLASGDCKKESGEEHLNLIRTFLDGISGSKYGNSLCVVSLASDGETWRGSAFFLLTFKCQLSSQSPICPLLVPLTFMDLHVGDDDLTCDKDWKHIFKRFLNLLLRNCGRGVVVNGFRVTPDILQSHFRANSLSVDHINSIFNPKDSQDVKLALDMFKDVWTLPRHAGSSRPGFSDAHEALWILGKLLFHMVFPFLCVDLSLSEQLEHLSAAAHLALVLYNLKGLEFIPTNLFLNLLMMIKNVFFCIAKSKIDYHDGLFWIILFGTDRLEIIFGILRTMIRNDANMDMLQLGSFSTATESSCNKP